jgi:hypothetical protein
MFARVATFEGVNVDAAKRSMDEAEARIRPLVGGLQGFQGLMELIAPEGKFLSITFFDSEANATAAEPVFDKEMPKQLGDLFESWEGHRVSVDRYEVLAESRT